MSSIFDRSEAIENPYIYPGFRAYLAQLAEAGGRILQLNRIGAITVVTAFRNIGEFETVLWDDRLPDWRETGVLVSRWTTLEVAEAFHFAYTRRIYATDFGGELRYFAKVLGPVAKTCVEEITSDNDLHLFEGKGPGAQ